MSDPTFIDVDPDVLLSDLIAGATSSNAEAFDDAAAELSAWLHQGGEAPLLRPSALACPATDGPHEGGYIDGQGDGPSGWACLECGATLPAPERAEP